MGSNRMSDDSGPSFELWRLDDNGNEFLIARFPDRASAEARLRELSRGGHKQTYWIDPPIDVPAG